MAGEPFDGPEASGCDIDLTENADDDETAELRALFPDGDPANADEWHALFDESDQ